MNWRHLKTLLWLRWRLSLNMAKRHGMFSMILTAIMVVVGIVGGLAMFFVSLGLGLFLLPKAEPIHLLYMFDGAVCGFLFMWAIGLMVEMQQDQVLSLEKLLRLPTTLKELFILNYSLTWAKLSLIIVAPSLFALVVALVVVKGPAMLVLGLTLLTFLFALTSITYQFQGWLAALMSNPRRRRTVVAVFTISFVLLTQIPNLVTQIALRMSGKPKNTTPTVVATPKGATADEVTRIYQEHADKEAKEREERKQQRLAMVNRTMTIASYVTPPGWLGAAAKGAAEGQWWHGLIMSAGFTLLGALSLKASYKQALNLAQGGVSAADTGLVSAKPKKANAKPAANWLIRNVRYTSERVSAMTWLNLRTMSRSHAVKLALLGPVAVLFGLGVAAVAISNSKVPMEVRPFFPLVISALTLVSVIPIFQNQFGLDGSGARMYVLSGAPGHDILLAKNLAIVPILLVLGVIPIIGIQILTPMHFSYFLASFLQAGIVFFLFCMVGNFISIFGAVPLAPGTLKPASGSGKYVLWQLLGMFLFSVAGALAAIPLMLDLGVYHYTKMRVPIYLLGSIFELGMVVYMYKQMLLSVGRLFDRRCQDLVNRIATQGE